jgi:DNA-binding MarR family transcriptional regulator
MTLNREALAELLGFRLRRVNLALSREFARATGDYGLREGEFTSLATIASNPGISQGEICRVTGLDKSAAVAVIDDLERRGWIARARAPDDRRRHVLRIEPAGQRALEDLVGRTRDIEGEVLAALTDAQRGALFAALDVLVERVLAGDR